MCPVMIITIYFEADHKKLVSSQKSSIFGPQKGHFVQSGPRNGPPNGQTATYQKTKGIQSSLRIWRSCHPIESGPSEPKKWGFHRCSVKKRRICLSPSWPDTKKTTFFCWPRCTAGLGPAAGAHFWPENLHFFMLHLWNPHFFGSDGPDRTDHKSPISWGNSG